VNFYNDIDPKCCAWTEELIRSKLIPPGDVVCKSILDIKSDELKKYNQVHLFNGIAGWALALQLAGWPADRPVWVASCPCQPFSTAGKGRGHADDRNLWPELFRLVRECRPGRIFGEQVAAAIGFGWLDGISTDLEAEGYAVGSAVLGAHSVGAPHKRQRLYWVANSYGRRFKTRSGGRSQGQESKGWDREPKQRSGFDRVAYATNHRRPQHEQKSGVWKTEGPDHASERFGNYGPAIALVQPNGAGRHAGRQGRSSARHRYSALATGDIIRVEYADDTGQQRWGERLEECAYQWPAGTPNLIVHCRDGKARRIESKTFPLADGFPCRVGILRGSGNAIVPQLAAEFIKAALNL
jgi:DNA (cytosine-5)-methyltransferase 1